MNRWKNKQHLMSLNNNYCNHKSTHWKWLKLGTLQQMNKPLGYHVHTPVPSDCHVKAQISYIVDVYSTLEHSNNTSYTFIYMYNYKSTYYRASLVALMN